MLGTRRITLLIAIACCVIGLAACGGSSQKLTDSTPITSSLVHDKLVSKAATAFKQGGVKATPTQIGKFIDCLITYAKAHGLTTWGQARKSNLNGYNAGLSCGQQAGIKG